MSFNRGEKVGVLVFVIIFNGVIFGVYGIYIIGENFLDIIKFKGCFFLYKNLGKFIKVLLV